jgi:hypothetical protein
MAVYLFKPVGPTVERIRVCTPALGVPVAAASQHPDAATVLARLREGNRPSLVDTIVGLTQAMETAYRGRISIFKRTDQGHDIFAPEGLNSGGDTMAGASWAVLGLPELPEERTKQQVYDIYLAWMGYEVFPKTNEPSNQAASRDFQRRFGVEVIHARSTHEVDYLTHFLSLLPEKVLDSGVLNKIDLNGRTTGPAKLGGFVNNTLTVHNYFFNWDRYFFTQVLLKKLGYVVLESLEPGVRQAMSALFDREIVSREAIPETWARNFARFFIEGSWHGQPLKLPDDPGQILRFKPK